MYKKVLVPLDGSALAECTLSHVKNLFKDGSVGEVTLLNVVKVDLPWAIMGSDAVSPEALISMRSGNRSSLHQGSILQI